MMMKAAAMLAQMPLQGPAIHSRLTSRDKFGRNFEYTINSQFRA
jgi:hypothetical protein